MSESLRRLGQISRDLEAAVNTYGPIAENAAICEAEHRRIKARFIVQARADGVKSMSEAETQADADETVADAHLARLLSAAQVDTTKARLIQLRSAVDVGRSFAVEEREADRSHAGGLGGAA